MQRLRWFAEIPAGLASVTRRILYRDMGRPPFSRIGNKWGYAEVIGSIMGVQAGQFPQNLLFVDVDESILCLLVGYFRPETMVKAAAILTEWEQRCRQEAGLSDGEVVEPAYPRGLPAEVTYRSETSDHGMSTNEDTAHETALADGAELMEATDPSVADGLPEGEDGEHVAGPHPYHKACHELWQEARATLSAGWGVGVMKGVVAPSKVFLDWHSWLERSPEEYDTYALWLANYILAISWSINTSSLSGYAGPGKITKRGLIPQNANLFPIRMAERLLRIASLPSVDPKRVAIRSTIPSATEMADWMGTPGDLSNGWLYSDPPYEGTMDYGNEGLPRERVEAFARDYASLGAAVAISEMVALPNLVSEGWHAVDIGAERKGRSRYFAPTSEYVTLNQSPVIAVSTQMALLSLTPIEPVKKAGHSLKGRKYPSKVAPS